MQIHNVVNIFDEISGGSVYELNIDISFDLLKNQYFLDLYNIFSYSFPIGVCSNLFGRISDNQVNS